ncbi:caspase-8 [Vanessa atalanta]|uniref:caspase-8 n=1 Tax=Vanessa atalanta TaxID=42275 RepID=UPI001FCCEE13|nr:caspase-8 [Vanessa atalanta]
MLRSDTVTQPVDNLFTNINNINIDILSELQKDVNPYDMVSLVFLLYDTPDTALQRLILYQRVTKDVEANNMNLLYDWALYAQSRSTWRYEFLEALAICRLYKVIRKLGFNVSNVKKHYLPDNIYVTVYIDPVKKALYKICENMTLEHLSKFKRTLISYKIDILEHDMCEIIFLELMSQKFILLGQYDKETKKYNGNYDIEELAVIFDNLSHFGKYATILREIKNQINSQNNLDSSKQMSCVDNKLTSRVNDSLIQSKTTVNDFKETFEYFNQLQLEEEPNSIFKSDRSKLGTDAYPLKNLKRIGVCCIINQEKFHPSKDSIKHRTSAVLSDRVGSTYDLIALEETMTLLNFEVISKSNLDQIEVFQFIKEVIKKHICDEDSVFMLCILSHGVRGHVYAADSTKIKIEDIQNLLDSDEAVQLHGIPKVLIIQACQIESEPEIYSKLVADSPRSGFYLKKSHFLIFWATAPSYEAFRNEDKGSLFIQSLCLLIKKRVEHEQICDIFTKVTDYVSHLCTFLKQHQVPFIETTLRKKLYLAIPH